MQKRISAQEENGKHTASIHESNSRKNKAGLRQYDVGRILDLQRILGNRAVLRLLKAEGLSSSVQRQEEEEKQEAETRSADRDAGASPDKEDEETGSVLRGIRTKLEVGSADDSSEHEAESVAERVTGFERSTGADLLRQALDSEDDQNQATIVGHGLEGHSSRAGAVSIGRLQVSAKGKNGGGAVPALIERRITQGQGTGQRLPAYIAKSMALHTGYDFSNVRVKTGPEAAALNRSLNARAFTLGADIWLGANESVHDLRLMAHELTHVIQQGSARRVAGNGLSTGAASGSVARHLQALKNQGPRGASLYMQQIRRFQREYSVDRIVALQRQILDATPAAINQKSGAGVLRRWGIGGGGGAGVLTFSSAAFSKGSGGKITFSNSGASAALQSPAYEATGKVTASGGTDADAKDWEAGFIQTLLSTSRAGHYAGSAKETKHTVTTPGPVRDALTAGGAPWYDPGNANGPGVVPFSKTGETVATKLWDRPGNPQPWATPDGKGKLDHTDGQDTFCLWMIARQKSAPNPITYVNWATWEVDWSTTLNYATTGAKTTASVTGALKVTGSGAGQGSETPVLSGTTANNSATDSWS